MEKKKKKKKKKKTRTPLSRYVAVLTLLNNVSSYMPQTILNYYQILVQYFGVSGKMAGGRVARIVLSLSLVRLCVLSFTPLVRQPT